MTKDNIKISAIVKTSNSEKTLCEVLEAIKDYAEIIVVDTHSTDDTIEIAHEYKTKIIYADKNEYYLGLNSALSEASNDWILVLEDDEIIPNKLLFELLEYIENPKKSKNAVSLSKKTFFLDKEIKSARIKKELRFFKKGFCSFSENYNSEIVLKHGKIHNINKNFKIKNACILKYSAFDIEKELNNLIQKNKNIIKHIEKKKPSIFIVPFMTFVYEYFIKHAFLDGRLGYIYAQIQATKKFILEIMILIKSEEQL